MSTFDPKDWLVRNAGGGNYDIETLDHVLWFTLIWNRFELTICNRNASLREIDRKVDAANNRRLISWDVFGRFWDAIRENIGVTDNLHARLLSDEMQTDGERDRVNALILMLQEDPPPEVVACVKAMLFIAFRVRNNLFHGEKCVTSLSRQRPLFEILNEMIATFIDAFSRQNSFLTDGDILPGGWVVRMAERPAETKFEAFPTPKA